MSVKKCGTDNLLRKASVNEVESIDKNTEHGSKEKYNCKILYSNMDNGHQLSGSYVLRIFHKAWPDSSIDDAVQQLSCAIKLAQKTYQKEPGLVITGAGFLNINLDPSSSSFAQISNNNLSDNELAKIISPTTVIIKKLSTGLGHHPLILLGIDVFHICFICKSTYYDCHSQLGATFSNDNNIQITWKIFPASMSKGNIPHNCSRLPIIFDCKHGANEPVFMIFPMDHPNDKEKECPTTNAIDSHLLNLSECKGVLFICHDINSFNPSARTPISKMSFSRRTAYDGFMRLLDNNSVSFVANIIHSDPGNSFYRSLNHIADKHPGIGIIACSGWDNSKFTSPDELARSVRCDYNHLDVYIGQ